MLPDPVEAVDLNIYGDAKLPWSRVQEALEAAGADTVVVGVGFDDAAARAAQAVRAVLAVDRLDDPGPHAQRRWLVDPRAGRRQPVPPALDLRRRRTAGRCSPPR